MRSADDISDSDLSLDVKRSRLVDLRGNLDKALAGDFGESRILPAFHHTMKTFGISPAYLHDLITGEEMDLSVHRYATFDELQRYCYCVAGTVGLCCVHVFGFQDKEALSLAPKLGIAFQLTNILRDIPEDYAMGRVYLPQEDLSRFGCPETDLGRGESTPTLIELMQFEAQRAWKFYDEGSRLASLVSRDSGAALWTLIRIYSGILRKIEELKYDVLANPRPRLSTAEKVLIMARAWTGLR